MLGHGAIGQFAIGEVGTATAETILADKWFVALSEPPRFKIGLKAGEQQFGSLPDLFPFVTFSYFVDLTVPAIRTRTGLKASEQQFAAADTAVIPVSKMAPWFTALSEPPRFKIGLPAREQQFSAQDTQVIPVSIMAWDVALSAPVRFKIGLRPPSQQFEARPPQLRPNPTTTGVLAAIETKDIFLAGIEEFNRVVSGEVGIHEASFTGAQIGVSKVSAITSARISISIL